MSTKRNGTLQSSQEPLSPAIMAVATIMIVPPVLVAMFLFQVASQMNGVVCLPGGNFNLPGATNILGADTFLAITVGFGKFSFAEAKTIDICWDVVIGRAGQILLAWTAFRVFSEVVVYIMATDAVTCESYFAVAFDLGSLRGAWALWKDFLLARFPKKTFSIVAYIVMALTTAYIAIFPTLMSAMTSYGAISEGVVLLDGANVPSDQWYRCFGVVVDGARVGSSWNETATDTSTALANNSIIDQQTKAYFESYYVNFTKSYEAANVSLFTGPFSEKNITASYLAGTELPQTKELMVTSRIPDLTQPLLNIKWFSDEDHGPDGQSYWCHGKDLAWSREDLIDSGSCSPGREYQWGFSYSLLLGTAIANTAILLMQYLLYTHIHFRPSSSYGIAMSLKTHRPERWGAVLDLAAVVRATDGEELQDWDRRKLDDHMRGQRMTFALEKNGREEGRFRVRRAKLGKRSRRLNQEEQHLL